MNSQHATNCEQVRRSFENREAIYVEQGALRVRITNIQANVAERYLTAQVEEIQTPELGIGIYRRRRPNESTLLRWDIGAGYLTYFSDDSWHMGYGMWSLYFATRVVEGVVDLASRWPENLDDDRRNKEVIDRLMEPDARSLTRPVFPTE